MGWKSTAVLPPAVNLVVPNHTPGQKGCESIKCLAQEHNAVPRLGLKPVPLDLEFSLQTIRPPHLHFVPRHLGGERNCLAQGIILQ